MAADIGPGSRLLALFNDCEGPIASGTVYTCAEVYRNPGFATCGQHGYTKDCFGIALVGITTPFLSSWASCGFRPIGGELPAEILECLNVDKARDPFKRGDQIVVPLITEPA